MALGARFQKLLGGGGLSIRVGAGGQWVGRGGGGGGGGSYYHGGLRGTEGS